MHDKFSDMQIFVAVVRANGFAAAAARMGVAKSGVSRRIKDLEERLAARLVNRTTRNFRLTDAGSLYFDRCVRVLRALDEAEDLSTPDELIEPSGELRVAAPPSFGTLQLLDHLARFTERYPRVMVDLHLSDRPINVVDEGVDIAIRIGDLRDSSLVARRLGEVRYVACASPGYLEAQGSPRHPEDLKKHRGLIVTNIDAPAQWQFRDIATRANLNVTVPAAFRSNSEEAVRTCAVLGKGIAVLPLYIVQDAVADGRLLPILEAFERKPAGVHIVLPQARFLPPKTRAFLDFIAEAFRSTAIETQRNVVRLGAPIRATG